jgi:4-hydroxybenzoate polyprenyltransferase
VLFWTAGFDVIYALQDESFDKEHGLYSMPAYFGREKALRISEWMHLGTAFLMVLAARLVFSEVPQTGWLLWTGTALFLVLLAWQHFLVKPNDLSRVNLAFFTTNGIASMIFGVFAIIDLLSEVHGRKNEYCHFCLRKRLSMPGKSWSISSLPGSAG